MRDRAKAHAPVLRRTLALVLAVIAVLEAALPLVRRANVDGLVQAMSLLLAVVLCAIAIRMWVSTSALEATVLGLFGVAQAAAFGLVLEGGARGYAAEIEEYRRNNPDAVVRYRGAREEHPVLGSIPFANSVTETLYPDNPREYFRTRDARWRLSTQPSSLARVERALNGTAVLIERADDPTPWHIQLTYRGLALEEDTEYRLRFRVRASEQREYRFAVSMDHSPWESLGLYRSATADTVWASVDRVFVATQSDQAVRVNFDLGGDTADVYVAELSVTRLPGGDSADGPPEVENYVAYEWNSRGCRADEYPVPAAPSSFRIVVLGDSYAEGVGVHAADTFTSILERLLRARAARADESLRFEVVNCAVRGFSTWQERLYYEERASAYQPDLVLLVMNRDDQTSGDSRSSDNEPDPPGVDFSESMDEVTRLRDLALRDGARLGLVLFRKDGAAGWQRLSESADSTAKVLGLPILDLRDAFLTTDRSGPVPRRLWRPGLTVHPLDDHPNEVAHRLAADKMLEWLAQERLTER